jgi:FAD/FMN-containing dehydrogenase
MESLNPHRPYPALDDERPSVWTLRSTSEAVRAVRYAGDSGLTIRLESDQRPAGTGSIAVAIAIEGPVRVDPIARTARIPAGTAWGEVVREVAANDLAFFPDLDDDRVITRLLGGSPSALGSGSGSVAASISSVTVVLADSRIVTVSANNDPEVLFALRGGAESIGLVTEVVIRLRMPQGSSALAGALPAANGGLTEESIRGRLDPYGMFDARHYPHLRPIDWRIA